VKNSKEDLRSYLTGDITAFIPTVQACIDAVMDKAQKANINLDNCTVKFTIAKVRSAWVVTLIAFGGGILHNFIESIEDGP